MSAFIDITGTKYGWLTVLSVWYRGKGKIKWKCLCDCGKETITTGSDLRTGNTMSCGCYKKQRMSEGNIRHGMADTPTHIVWMGMFQRCNNPRASQYKYYGARGITVCKRWRRFENFFDDMGIRPKGKSIDRINTNGNYEPGNCRWATPKQQSNNTRVTTFITYLGKKKSINEWSEIIGIKTNTLRYRIHKLNWLLSDAMELPNLGRKKYASLANRQPAQ